MADQWEKLKAENEQLKAENATLRRDLERIAETKKQYRKITLTFTEFAVKLIAGLSLTTSARRWFKSLIDQKRLDAEETADFVAAILRRMIRVGTVGLVISIIPFLLLIQQNFLLAQQNRQIQRQIDAQSLDTRFARRAQLLETIYNPQINIRVRAEALKAYVEMERTELKAAGIQAGTINLSGAILAGAQLQGVHLENVDFSGANLRQANFDGANLKNVSFRRAKLDGATFVEANLEDAKLYDAELPGADLSQANLKNADLRNTNLQKAKLWETNVKGADFSNADLRQMVLFDTDWKKMKSIKGANISGINIRLDSVRQEFVTWAKKNGAVN